MTRVIRGVKCKLVPATEGMTCYGCFLYRPGKVALDCPHDRRKQGLCLPVNGRRNSSVWVPVVKKGKHG